MTFNVLHVSDTHLWREKDKPLGSGVVPYASLAATLDAAAADFTARGTRPHCVLLTGDITHDDTEEAYMHVASMLDAFCAAFEKQEQKRASNGDDDGDAASSTRRIPLLCIEGNHGDPTVCSTVFGRFPRSICVAAAGTAERSSVQVVQLGKAWQIALTSTHSRTGANNEIAEIFGVVTDSDLKALQQFVRGSGSGTGSSGDAAMNKIVCLHHPPLHPPSIQAGPDQSSWAEFCLRGPSRKAMRDLIYGPGNDALRLVLHGHLHIDLAVPAPPPHETDGTNADGERAFSYMPRERGANSKVLQLCAPATCHQSDPASWGVPAQKRHGCRVIELHEDGSFEHRAVWAQKVCAVM